MHSGGGGSETERKWSLVGWFRVKAVLGCSGVPEAKRKGVRPRGCTQIAFFFFSFFWELGSMYGKIWMFWLSISLVLCPPLLFRDRRRASFSSERTVAYLFRFAAFTSAILLYFLFLALVSISVSLSLSSFSFFVDIRVPWADLPFSVFFFFRSTTTYRPIYAWCKNQAIL